MRRNTSVINIAFMLLLSKFLLVQTIAVVTDIHFENSETNTSIHHVDSHVSLAGHAHIDYDSDEFHNDGHCCHAYTSTSITTNEAIIIETVNNVVMVFRLPESYYDNPHIARLQRPPKT